MIFTSSPTRIDVPPHSWPRWFLQAIEPFDNGTALIEAESGRSFTYSDLKSAIHAVSGALRARGLLPGDIVVLFGGNSPEYVIAFQAILLAGGVVSTANPQYTVAELARQMDHAAARWLCADSDVLDKAEAAAAQCRIESLLVLHLPDGESSHHISVRQMLESGDGSVMDPPTIEASKTIAVLPYSSGTTGLPKGVMLSHSNLVANCLQQATQKLTRNADIGDVLLGVCLLYTSPSPRDRG